MLEQNDSLALAALLVALVALLNSVLQVLQQYFATADGYRRCSPSVIGEWARFTRRKFIFRELRFETVFASPFICMEVAYDMQELQKIPEAGAIAVLDGSEEMSKWPGLKSPSMIHDHVRNTMKRVQEKSSLSRPKLSWSFFSQTLFMSVWRREIKSKVSDGQLNRTRSWLCEEFMQMDRDPAGDATENEPVSWISLLQALQSYSSALRACGLATMQDTSTGSLRHGRVLAPTLRLSKKSWDFVPPEVLKPYAVTTVRDIAIMAQLLGLQWTVFNPEEGIMRAEGDGCIITSFQIRPLGTMVSFLKTDRRIEHRRNLHGVSMSPLEGAIALGFGILYSHFAKDYGGHHEAAKDYHIYSIEDCKETIISLCSNAASRVEEVSRKTLETIVTDFLGFLAPVLRVRGTSITYIVKPSMLMNPDIMSTRGSFFEFLTELEKQKLNLKPYSLRKDDSTLGRIYSIAHRLARSSGWDKDLGRLRLAYTHHTRSAVLELIQDLHFAWERMNTFLSRLSVSVRAIISSHFSAMLDTDYEIDHLQPNLPSRYLENSKTARTKMMEFYFHVCRPRCTNEVSQITGKEVEEIEEMWVALMFQSICWHALHNIDDKVVAVPPRYFDSNLPIYIS